MWNSFDSESRVGVTAETKSIPGSDGEIRAYVARGLTEGPVPGIVLIHHAPGWDEFYQEFAERLARHGYQVVCPNLYRRFGSGTPDEVTAKMRAAGGITDDDVVADCEDALDYLRAQPDNNGKVGIIGSCSGGRHAVLVASRVPRFDAVVDLWGGVVQAELTPARPVAPIDYTADLNAPLLGLFGNDDQNPSPESVDTHEAALKEHGKDYEFHRYDGAGHGFFYYDRANYRQEQAMDGWSKVFSFFDDRLKS